MLDIGLQELLVLMVLALLVFGPDKLPELGKKLGRAMREFRRASDEFRQTVETNLQIHESILPPSATEPSPAAVTEGASPEGTPLVAEVPPEPEPVREGDGTPGPAEPPEPFWARRNGKLLHRYACVWRTRVPEAERLPLKTATDGWDMGLQACPACDPRAAEAVS
jgi:TatA/E family protein of Tat protein translocase